MKSFIKLQRQGDWVDRLVVILSGYSVNDHEQIIKSETTLFIPSVEFDEIVITWFDPVVVEGDYPYEIPLAGKKYYFTEMDAQSLFICVSNMVDDVFDYLPQDN